MIEALLKYYKLSASAFASALGYDRPQIIYDIQKGKTKNLSSKLIDKIISAFPSVNKLWLLTGEGDMIASTMSVHNDSGVLINGANTNSPIDNRHYYSDSPSPDVLKAQIDLLDERIKEKDAQIKEKDAQIKEKDAQIRQLLEILKTK